MPHERHDDAGATVHANGVLTTMGTSKPIIDLLYSEMRGALQLPDVRQRLDQLGSEIVGDGPILFLKSMSNLNMIFVFCSHYSGGNV